MPKYKEEVIIIDINDRPMFGENMEDAMRQGYVPHGDPLVYDGQYVQVMVTQKLKRAWSTDQDIRAYMRDLDEVRRQLAEKAKKKEEVADDGSDKEDPIPFG